MDPTIVRQQKPTKRFLSNFVHITTSLLLPATTTPLVTIVAIVGRETFPLFSLVLFWSITYEAVTSFRNNFVLPREFDLSLDPTSSQYCQFLFLRCMLSIAIVLLSIVLVLTQAPFTFLVLLFSVTSSSYVFIRNLLQEETYGKPQVEFGSTGLRIKPLRFLQTAFKNNGNDIESIWWGGLELPISHLLRNFLIIGSVGSGKTLVLKQWLQTVLPLVTKSTKSRALIVDPKFEFYGFLAALLPTYKIKILNPSDARTYAWAISSDLTTGEEILAACFELIPVNENETQRFFGDAARRLSYATMLSLNAQSPGNWWFSDVVYIARNTKRLTTILGLHHEAREILETYNKNERVFADCTSTLDSKIGEFATIAAVWRAIQLKSPERVVSLKDWVNANYLLLIGKKASASEAHTRLIHLLLKQASKLLLDGPTGQSTLPPSVGRRTIIAIDEAPRAGRSDIIDLVTNGRDYGIGVCVVTQSIDAMLQHFAKREDWDAIANEFHSQAFLTTNSPTTRSWMSDRIGKIYSRRNWMPALDPSQFQSLGFGKTIGPNCIPGIFSNSQLGPWYSDTGVDLVSPVPDLQNLKAIGGMELSPWTDSDYTRLNLDEYRDELEQKDNTPKPATAPTSRWPGAGHAPRFRT